MEKGVLEQMHYDEYFSNTNSMKVKEIKCIDIGKLKDIDGLGKTGGAYALKKIFS
jgi:hypothetical protein